MKGGKNGGEGRREGAREEEKRMKKRDREKKRKRTALGAKRCLQASRFASTASPTPPHRLSASPTPPHPTDRQGNNPPPLSLAFQRLTRTRPRECVRAYCPHPQANQGRARGFSSRCRLHHPRGREAGRVQQASTHQALSCILQRACPVSNLRQ